jgi:hypothetical protein
MNRIVEIIVAPCGAVRLQTLGYEGPDCRAASAPLRAALGLAQSEQLTPEYYAAVHAPAHAQERQGH